MSSTNSTGAVQALVGRLQASATLEDVMSFATELGHLFAERPLASVQARELRLELLKVAKKRDEASAVAMGAFASFLVAYEASRQSVENEADAAANLDAADWEILRQLSKQPATPSELAGGKDNGKLSRRLSVLEDDGLIAPSASARDGRSRPRELTALGHLLVARGPQLGKTPPLAIQTPPAPAVHISPTMPLSTWLDRGVESTLRALKGILFSSERAPMQRREVEASFAPELREHGLLQAFDYHVEAFGLADIDDGERYWSTTSRNHHTDRWALLMSQLGNPQLCQRVFHAHPDEEYALVTVSERQEQWRQVLRVLTQRIEVYTLESWRHIIRNESPAQLSLIVDDSTLASKVGRSYAAKLFTLEPKLGAQEPELRRLQSSSLSASA